jgi:hypothetical protein
VHSNLLRGEDIPRKNMTPTYKMTKKDCNNSNIGIMVHVQEKDEAKLITALIPTLLIDLDLVFKNERNREFEIKQKSENVNCILNLSC